MFLIILALIAQVWGAEPFWRAKDKVYSRIREREIVVSVNSEAVAQGPAKNLLTIVGGGQMQTPCDFAFSAAQDYEGLAKESGYVEEARYTPADQKLPLKMKAFGHRENATLQMTAGKYGERDAIFYEIIGGRMKGFKGRFEFYPVPGKGKLCDIGTAGEYYYDKLPLPKMFVTFGLEVMFQRMAGRLRAFTENNYRKKEP